VANLVVHSDLNCLSVLQYAVDILKVRHIIVCGHYGCGGVQAAMRAEPLGLIDNWLRHIEDIEMRFSDELHAMRDETARLNRLCELNVIEQAVNICRSTVVEDAWRRWQPVAVHAWIYGIDNGLLHDLGLHVTGLDDLDQKHARAIHARLSAKS
jgi:carbonic anhydrase